MNSNRSDSDGSTTDSSELHFQLSVRTRLLLLTSVGVILGLSWKTPEFIGHVILFYMLSLVIPSASVGYDLTRRNSGAAKGAIYGYIAAFVSFPFAGFFLSYFDVVQ